MDKSDIAPLTKNCTSSLRFYQRSILVLWFLPLSQFPSNYAWYQERVSTETKIVLKSVQMSSEGSYLCEVSGEAPLFQTAKNQNFLSVVGKSNITYTHTLLWNLNS